MDRNVNSFDYKSLSREYPVRSKRRRKSGQHTLLSLFFSLCFCFRLFSRRKHCNAADRIKRSKTAKSEFSVPTSRRCLESVLCETFPIAVKLFRFRKHTRDTYRVCWTVISVEHRRSILSDDQWQPQIRNYVLSCA